MDADDLYGLPLDEFVPQRAALAKALRADKRRDEAAAVAALRKPSIAAWAVNQLVRTQRDSMHALFDAGDGLRGAQEDLLAGSGDGRKLRAAGERERAAVDTLVEAARGLLTSGGYELSAAVVERVDETLHAAALDEEAREQVRDGRLERELRHVGLGLGFGEAISATPAPRPPRAPKGASGSVATAPSKGASRSKDASGPKKRGASKGATEQEREEQRRAAQEEREEAKRVAQAARAEAERAERERAAARKAARATETAARRRAQAAARAVEKAEGRRETAAQALQEADEALTSARDDAEEATAEHERAQAALEAL